MRVYTVGHSTSTLEEPVGLMRKIGVGTIVDVRSRPLSRLHHFARAPLERALKEAGIGYRFMGDLLGGMPRDPGLRERWRQGRLDPVIVAGLRASDEWRHGIAELSRLVISNGDSFICILCSESDPNECHRKAVALDLAKMVPEVEIIHLAVGKKVPSDIGIQEVLM